MSISTSTSEWTIYVCPVCDATTKPPADSYGQTFCESCQRRVTPKELLVVPKP